MNFPELVGKHKRHFFIFLTFSPVPAPLVPQGQLVTDKGRALISVSMVYLLSRLCLQALEELCACAVPSLPDPSLTLFLLLLAVLRGVTDPGCPQHREGKVGFVGESRASLGVIFCRLTVAIRAM